MITQDAETGQELERRDLVKGYEFRKNQYVLLNDEDLASVRVESSSVITVENFVDTVSIDPVHCDAAYYLATISRLMVTRTATFTPCCGKRSQDGKTVLARVVIFLRERTIAIRPTGDGLMAHTLYEERDLNDSKDLFEGLAGIKLDPEMVQLASQFVERQSGKYDAADLEDRYGPRLRAMIDANLKGEGLDVSEPEEPARTNVVDLMAALKKSLGLRRPKRSQRRRRGRLPPRSRRSSHLRQHRPSESERERSQPLPTVVVGQFDRSLRGKRCNKPRYRMSAVRPRNRQDHSQGTGSARPALITSTGAGMASDTSSLPIRRTIHRRPPGPRRSCFGFFGS